MDNRTILMTLLMCERGVPTAYDFPPARRRWQCDVPSSSHRSSRTFAPLHTRNIVHYLVIGEHEPCGNLHWIKIYLVYISNIPGVYIVLVDTSMSSGTADYQGVGLWKAPPANPWWTWLWSCSDSFRWQQQQSRPKAETGEWNDNIHW